MGMLLGGAGGLQQWQDGWTAAACPLRRVDLIAHADGCTTAVDNEAHRLWHGGRVIPCDRDVEALALWQHHALTLSSDTDCLSIADAQGWLVTARVGMYPQDMAVSGNVAHVCGGSDGAVHLLSLPELQHLCALPVPGMPERIAVQGDAAYLLCLAAEDEVQTTLLHLDLHTGAAQPLAHFSGLPGALHTGTHGLWCAVSERLMHYPPNSTALDVAIEGFGLIRHLDAQGEHLLATDPLEGMAALVTGQGSVQVLHRGDVGQAILI